MRKLLTLSGVLIVAAGLSLTAGGWAVVTVDTLPDALSVSTPVRLAFSVRQHGHMLMDGLKPAVRATSGTDAVAAEVRPAGREGQYVATLTFPRAADWVISIDSGFGINSRLTLLPLPVAADAAHAAPPLTAAARGRQLFVAKGCVTCHQNELGTGNTSLGVGPALIAGKHQDGLLASFLLKPESKVIPPTQANVVMPNLNLRPDEVSSLVAFINSAATPVASR